MSISDYWIITKILDSALREGFTDKLSASTTIVDRYWLCLLLDLKRNHSEYDQLELFPLINPVKWINVLCFNKPTVPPTSLDWQNQCITCDVPKQWDSFMIQLFKTEECSPNTLHPWNDFAFYLNNPRVVIFSSVWHKSCSWCLINLKLTSNKLFLFFFLILTLITWCDWQILQSDGGLILFFSLIIKADHYWVTTNEDIWCRTCPTGSLFRIIIYISYWKTKIWNK